MEVTSQSYIALPHASIYLLRPLLKPTSSLLVPSSSEIGGFRLRSSKEESASCEEMALCNGLEGVISTSTTSFDGVTNQLIDRASQEYLGARWFDGIWVG